MILHTSVTDEVRGCPKISMTEVNHCYENVIYTIFLTTPCCAARINKTLKFEFGLRYTFNDFKEAQSAIKQAVFLYNNVRLHQHLGFFTPEFVHQAS
ncbi:Uncharacterized protein XB16_0156 [Leptospira santarosai]|uniref:Integrase catalytic domain-containing protein n=3 Tax=Leptospira santarosai TaxID=28183 RepID=A0A2P1QNN7_9LEPT|nr:Uncharacterized protein XB16_0156 [Leptospira santarosai]